jgi:hypothetical protein
MAHLLFALLFATLILDRGRGLFQVRRRLLRAVAGLQTLSVCCKIPGDYFSQPFPATHNPAVAVVGTGKPEIADLVVVDIQQGDQGNFLLFLLRFGLTHQGNRIDSFDETLAREFGYLFEVEMPHAPWNTACHDCVPR